MRDLQKAVAPILSMVLVILSGCQEPFVAPQIEMPRSFPLHGSATTIWEVKSERSLSGVHGCELNDGSVVVVGSGNALSNGSELYVANYSPVGSLRWDTTFTEVEATNGTRIAQLMDGSILVITTTKTNGLALIDLSQDGSVMWTSNYSNHPSRYIPHALLASPDGGIVICGLNDIDYKYDEGFTMKFDAKGNMVWEHAIPCIEGGAAEAVCLVHDGSNDVLVTGHSNTRSGRQDLFINRYSQAGELVWAKSYATASFYPGMGLSYDKLNKHYIVSAGQSYDMESIYAGKFIYVNDEGIELAAQIYRHNVSFPQSVFATDSGFFSHEDTWLHFVGETDTSSVIIGLSELQDYRYFLTRLSNGEFLVVGSTPPFAERISSKLLIRRFRVG